VFKGLQGGIDGKRKEGTLKIESEHFVRFFCKNVAEMGPMEGYNVIKSGGKMKRTSLINCGRPVCCCPWKTIHHGEGFMQRRKGGTQRPQRKELNRKDRNRGAKRYAFPWRSLRLLCALCG
jgi:hypothetical protein